jgi:hypothetical protein
MHSPTIKIAFYVEINFGVWCMRVGETQKDAIVSEFVGSFVRPKEEVCSLPEL